MEAEQRSALIAEAKRGDPAAFEALVRAYLPQLHAFVHLRLDPVLRRREGSLDLVQSVCVELYEHLDECRFDSEPQFRAWLFTTALNKLREHGRFHRRARRDAAREERLATGDSAASGLASAYATLTTPSKDAASREELERFAAAFDRMPDHYREVVALARVAGLPHDEVAARMQRSVGAVRQMLGRALIQLAQLLEAGDSDGRR